MVSSLVANKESEAPPLLPSDSITWLNRIKEGHKCYWDLLNGIQSCKTKEEFQKFVLQIDTIITMRQGMYSKYDADIENAKKTIEEIDKRILRIEKSTKNLSEFSDALDNIRTRVEKIYSQYAGLESRYLCMSKYGPVEGLDIIYPFQNIAFSMRERTNDNELRKKIGEPPKVFRGLPPLDKSLLCGNLDILRYLVHEKDYDETHLNLKKLIPKLKKFKEDKRTLILQIIFNTISINIVSSIRGYVKATRQTDQESQDMLAVISDWQKTFVEEVFSSALGSACSATPLIHLVIDYTLPVFERM